MEVLKDEDGNVGIIMPIEMARVLRALLGSTTTPSIIKKIDDTYDDEIARELEEYVSSKDDPVFKLYRLLDI